MKSLVERGPRRVESRQNGRIKELRAGLLRGVITANHCVAIEGLHLVQEAAKSGLRLHTVLVRAGNERLLEQLAIDGADVLIVADEVFSSAMTTEHPQGIAALVEAPAFRVDAMLATTPLVVIVAGLQDPGNLGTLVRSAEAFGATGMILLPGTVSLWNAKTLRASSGSAFRLPVLAMAGEEAFAMLRAHGVKIFATVARGGETAMNLQGPSALLMGNEGAGLPQEWIDAADARLTIPCPGQVESLNAAVAGSVLLYEAMRQRGGRGRVEMNLFSQIPDERQPRTAPLAERMRPRTLDEYTGQEHLLGPGKSLRLEIERDDLGSMILWGPPGVGKTTLAKIIAEATQASFLEFSAVMGGIKEIKQVMVDAEKAAGFGSRTILFIDEIHRFNKAQQDAFLPYVERGTIRLIGATTENPSFEIIAALLSRCRVYRLMPLTDEQQVLLLKRALGDEQRGLGRMKVSAEEDALAMIAGYANGDARYAYNALETAAKVAAGGTITRETVQNALQQRVLLYDKQGEEHFNLISALHKSIRNSDADASLYWLGRMLQAGEDPMYVARRLVRMAVEDIGLASPEALRMALTARDAIDFLGSPEGDLALAQAAVFLALSPKSNALYTAYSEVTAEIEAHRAEPVPLHLRNAPTRLMKQFGYGEGYQYAHDVEEGVADMECMPANLLGREFYHPRAQGREKLLAQRMEEIREIRATKQGRKPETP